MSVVDEQETSEFSSFWELKCYSRTVKRIENSNKLCSDLYQMINERAAIENGYSENLRKWSNKWNSLIETGIEYGTGSYPWLGICEEANKISQMHKNIADILNAEIQPYVKRWHKDNFHKSHVPVQSIKEAKMYDHDFEAAQKPWAKKLKKVSQSQKDYYLACKAVRSLKVQAENAHSDPSGNAEQIKKIQEKTKKAETDEARTLAAYQMALSELDSDKSRYIEDMQRVFQKSQCFEADRLKFFKETFISLYEALDLTKKSQIEEIYRTLNSTINKSTVNDDLHIWSTNHGIDMPFVFPQFEEYSPELASISKKKTHGTVSDSGSKGIILTGISQVGSPRSQNGDDSNPNGAFNRTSSVTQAKNAPMHDNEWKNNNNPPVSDQSHPSYDYDDDSTMNDFLYDDGKPGVPVRALYDYIGVEEDEITFNAGDVFEKLEDENEQGWAKGRKGGRVGLYPANYVELA